MPEAVLQPAAPGLLSMLELKARGFNPDKLSDTVQPTIDLTHWYGADRPQVVSGVEAIASGVLFDTVATFSSSPLAVPDGEIWWVREYMVQLNCTPATATWAYLGIAPALVYREIDPALSRRGMIIGKECNANSSLPVGAGIAPGTGGLAVSPALRNFWAPTGSQFGVYLHSVAVLDAVNPIRAYGTAVVNKFKI